MIRGRLVRTFLLSLMMLAPTAGAFGQEDEARAQRLYEHGRTLYRAGRTAQAIEELYTALTVREVYFEAQMLLARSLLEARRPREAAGVLRGIDSIERGKVAYHRLLGQANYQINKVREAEESFRYVIAESRHPDPEMHHHLGLTLFRHGDARGAIREAKRALAVSHDYAPARKLLSDAYLLEKDAARSARELARYLRGVRDRAEIEELRERLRAIRSLAGAKSDRAVTGHFTPPLVHRVPQPAYTPEARRGRIEGTVKLEVLLGSDEAVRQVVVVQGLGYGLDEAAAAAAQWIEFSPGRLDGHPVSAWLRVHIRFDLGADQKRDPGGERIAAVRSGRAAPGRRAPRPPRGESRA